ncbi:MULTISPECIES: hypothetical protein [unclassified Terrabacter]|uniref:hypothetical protein n=1 Tax=unclassified Terrabacter TaxID=2630222 RepID=UPI0012FAE5F3|nr:MULTISPECIES: hypothetical protein [unclassified Terrabacter]
MTPHESHLQSDGSVFPPVTPDPPLPPGQAEIKVPDMVPVASPDGPDTEVSTRETTDATSEVAGVRPDPAD